jgi:hypothetical protein
MKIMAKSKRKYNPKKSKEWNEKCEQAWFDTFAEATNEPSKQERVSRWQHHETYD